MDGKRDRSSQQAKQTNIRGDDSKRRNKLTARDAGRWLLFVLFALLSVLASFGNGLLT